MKKADEPRSRGIVDEGGENITIRGNTIVGYDDGVVLKGTVDARVVGNTILTKEAAAVFDGLRKAVEQAPLDPDDKKRIHEAVKGMEAEFGQKGYVERYQKFVAAAANHMQVLGPTVASLFPQLAAFIR